MSTIFPFRSTSGCFVCMSQPTWAKKKPRCELCGSASVSLNLWCTRWSRTQSNIVFCWPVWYYNGIRNILTTTYILRPRKEVPWIVRMTVLKASAFLTPVLHTTIPATSSLPPRQYQPAQSAFRYRR